MNEPRTIWEYEFFIDKANPYDSSQDWPNIESVKSILAKLNEIGAQGWEAVRINPVWSGKTTIYAKRPKFPGVTDATKE